MKSIILVTTGLFIIAIFVAYLMISSDLSSTNKSYLSPERVLAFAGNDSVTQNQTDNITTSTDGINGTIVILPPSSPLNILEDRYH